MAGSNTDIHAPAELRTDEFLLRPIRAADAALDYEAVFVFAAIWHSLMSGSAVDPRQGRRGCGSASWLALNSMGDAAGIHGQRHSSRAMEQGQDRRSEGDAVRGSAASLRCPRRSEQGFWLAPSI